MILYRSIGESELRQLLSQYVINGRYDCETECQNSNGMKNAVCFFVDEVRWSDAAHKYMIVVDIPVEELAFGCGTYHAAASLRKTKVWTGRDGSELYSIREAYASTYDISQVKELYLLGHYAKHHVDDYIRPICNKHGITCYHMGTVPFENSTQKFVKDGIMYKTVEATGDWMSFLVVDEDKYIKNTKDAILAADITIEQARKIQSILRQK